MKQRSIFIFVLLLAAVAIDACSNNSNPSTPITYSSGNNSNSTPTATFTNTFVCAFTATPTFTVVPSGANSVVVAVNYTGAGTVSGSNVIAAYLTNAVGSGAATQLFQTSAANGNTFTFTNIAAGNYYFAALYDVTGIGYTAPSGNFNPHISDDYAFYTGSGTTSGTAPSGGAAGSGNVVVVTGIPNNLGTVSFAATNVFQGVSGTINYTGAKGSVDCRNLYIETFQDSLYTIPIAATQVSSNNTHYDQLDLGTVTSGQAVYVMAWYDYNNTGGNVPSTGDPVTLYGAATSPSTSANITLTDAHLQ
jgi:hypothetical protein